MYWTPTSAGAAPGGLWDVEWRLYAPAADLLRVAGAGAGVYMEEAWGWVADHDIDSGADITVVNPRGATFDAATGGSVLYGVAMEHSAEYQFNVSHSPGVLMAIAQTESPYWQVPVTAWALTVDASDGLRLYGTGNYNWFHGNQTALINITNTTGQGFGVNVHGTNQLVVGDVSLPAYSPVEENWFCDGPAILNGKM